MEQETQKNILETKTSANSFGVTIIYWFIGGIAGVIFSFLTVWLLIYVGSLTGRLEDGATTVGLILFAIDTSPIAFLIGAFFNIWRIKVNFLPKITGPKLIFYLLIFSIIWSGTLWIIFKLNPTRRTENLNNKEYILKIIRDSAFDPVNLKNASEKIKNDKEVILEAVKKDGASIFYASQELRADREIVLEAVRTYSYALSYASQELQNDKEIVLEAVKHSRLALEFASQRLQNDPDILRAAGR